MKTSLIPPESPTGWPHENHSHPTRKCSPPASEMATPSPASEAPSSAHQSSPSATAARSSTPSDTLRIQLRRIRILDRRRLHIRQRRPRRLVRLVRRDIRRMLLHLADRRRNPAHRRRIEIPIPHHPRHREKRRLQRRNLNPIRIRRFHRQPPLAPRIDLPFQRFQRLRNSAASFNSCTNTVVNPTPSGEGIRYTTEVSPNAPNRSLSRSNPSCRFA